MCGVALVVVEGEDASLCLFAWFVAFRMAYATLELSLKLFALERDKIY
jgi:hypothetical protein